MRAVRRGDSLAGGGIDLEGLLVLLPLALVFGGPFTRWQERQPWKLGVVRFKGDRWGATGAGRAEVVHRELVPGIDVPRARLGELADRVRSGAFDT